MDLTASLIPPAGAGVALALFVFATRWLTIRQLPHSGRPRLVHAVSIAFRVLVALVVLVAVGSRGWEALVACLAGFVAARAFLASWEPTPQESSIAGAAEVPLSARRDG